MSDGAEGQQQVSKYNSAVAQLYRLDQLWQDAHRYSRSGNYVAWNITLDKIWSEMAGDLKDYDKEHKMFVYFAKMIAKEGLKKEEVRGFNGQASKEKNISYIALLSKEIWLRKIQNRLGKGTKWDEGEDDYMD